MEHVTYLIDGATYNEAQTKSLFVNGKLGAREEVALSMLKQVADNALLVDLGCLYGFFGSALHAKYPQARIIAGDYDAENLKVAHLLHPNIKQIFSTLNAYSLDLKDSSVDCLFFQEVIEHLEGAATAVKEINRVLKPGATLIISTPTPYYWKDMWQTFKYEILRAHFKKSLPLTDAIYFAEHEWNRHIYCWTPATLYTLLKVNGFEYVQHKYCQEAHGFFSRMLLKIFPFLSPTMILEVKKVTSAPSKVV